MKISRFFGVTTREAMRQVRLSLGPDALIVSNRRVDGGVEILAADPDEVPTAGQSAAGSAKPAAADPLSGRPSHDSAAGAPTRGVPLAPSAASPITPSVPSAASPVIPSPKSPLGAYAAAFQAAYGPVPETPTPQVSPPRVMPSTSESVPLDTPPGTPPADILDALGDMRGALENRIDELLWGNQLRQSPQAATLFQTLLGMGFSTSLLRALLQHMPAQLSNKAAMQWVREQLTSKLLMLASEDELWRPGLVLALVGPTGVGKTTTIAKLAARCVRRFGPDKLVLITTDTYRIGAHEQLKIYGQMLRSPVHVVRSADELKDVIAGVRPDQVILIDNVGISQRDRYIHEQAALLAAAGREVSRLLVLNAASHGETLDEVARRYRDDGGTPLKGCIISKVDEATRLGAALDTALRYRLPIHYVSIGQKVPEHLVFLSAADLIDRALTPQPASRTLYAPTEADFAALLAMSRPSVPEAGPEAAARQRLLALPRLLSISAGGAAHLSESDLRAGCHYVDELPAVSEAYDLWRISVTQEGGPSGLDASIRQMLRIVRDAWGGSEDRKLLAVHDQLPLKAADEPRAQLRATLVLDEQGAALATPLQQLTLSQGWLSSAGFARPQAPSTSEALLLQLDYLAEQAAEIPLIHLFEGGNGALWRGLVERGQPWLAQVPPITRVDMDDGSTTAIALAKTLAHQPVADPDYLFGLAEVAGGPAESRALWVASVEVAIKSRGQPALPLHMVSAMLVDRLTGKRVRHLVGLHAGLAYSAGKLASWLVLKAESREAMRHAAKAWHLLGSSEGAGVQDKALVACQLGLAAWELQKHPLAQQGRKLAANMLGRKHLPVSAASAATLKLFALKEMLGAQT